MIFEFKSYKVSYEKWGRGNHVLIAFHGFGQSSSIFSNIAPAFEDTFTVYACSLFYHDQSSLPGHLQPGTALPPQFLVEGVLEFCRQNSIQKFSLLGYSLGGRLSLQLVQSIPEKIESLILLAPDGVKKSKWYYFATHHFVGKRIFRKVVYQPQLLFSLVNTFRVTGIVNEKLKKFVYSQFGNQENRLKVMHVWNTYAQISPRIRVVKGIIHKHSIRTLVFTGSYDPVLDSDIGKIMSAGLEEEVKWVVIKAGHDLLKPAYAEIIKTELDWLHLSK